MDITKRSVLLEWGVVMCIVFGVAALLLTPATRSRRTNNNDYCKGLLKHYGIALKKYHDDWGSFPPAYHEDENGVPCHSWRTLILPYFDNGPLFTQYRLDKPWNSSWNRETTAAASVHCKCPSSGAQTNDIAHYLAVVGPETAWPGARGAKLTEDFPGGLDRTILLVEVLNSGIHWSEPRDLRFPEMSFQINHGSSLSPSSNHGSPPQKQHINVLFADGHVESLPSTTPPNVLRALLTTADD